MSVSILILMSIGLVLGAVVQCVAPVTLRSSLFFGVTVAPEFLLSPNAQRLLARYRQSIIATMLVGIASLWLVVPRLTGIAAPLACSGVVFCQTFVAIVFWGIASRRVRPFTLPHTPTRTASLTPRVQTLPGGWLTFAGPMLVVLATHFLVWTRNHALPLETYRAALALLLVAYVANALYLWIAWLILFRTRHIHPSGSISQLEESDRRFGYGLRLTFAYYFSVFVIVMALQATHIIPAIKGPLPVLILLGATLVMMAVIVGMVLRRQGGTFGSRASTIGDGTSDAFWKSGIIYYNPDDPAFVVGARTGPYGCDLNFGNKWAWLVSFGLVSVPLVIRQFWF